MTRSDEDLMRRVQAGDPEALGILFDRHHLRLYAFLRRVTGNSTAAEDLVGEAFLRVWRSRSTYDARRSFAVWLFTLARRLCLDDWKKGCRLETPLSNLEGDERAMPGATGSEAGSVGWIDGVERSELKDQVRSALLTLPEDQRIAVALREYDGCSYREIGEVLGCAEGNARVLTHRARASLRKILKPYMSEEEDPCLR